MKPKDLYSGAGPEKVFSQMGQGFAEAGARIGGMEQQKYASQGQAIAGMITGVAGAYAQHQELKASNDANKKLLDNPKVQEMFGISKDQAKQMSIDADNLGTQGAAKMFDSFMPMAFKSSMQQRSDQAQSMQPWNAEAARAAYRQVAPPIYGGSSADAASTPFSSVYHPDNNSGLGSVNPKSLPLPVDDTSGEDMPVPYRSGRKQPFLFNDESLFPRR